MSKTFREKYSFWIALPILVGGFYSLFARDAQVGAAVLGYLSLLGIDVIKLGVETHKKAKGTLSWHSTKGEIINLKKKKHRSSSRGACYSLEIEYAYCVNGRDYTNNEYNMYGGIISSSERKIDKIEVEYLDRISDLTVFYNPEAPEISLLNTGYHLVIYLGVVMGFAMILICGSLSLDLFGVTNILIKSQ